MKIKRYLGQWIAHARPGAGKVLSVESVLYGLLLAAAATVPLVLSPWHYNAFELPKAILGRGLAGLSLLCLVYALPAIGLRRWLRRPLVGLTLALCGVLLAATVFSIDSRLSLWGSYERQFGLLTWLTLLALFLAALTVLEGEKRRRILVQVLVWSSAPIVLYGLAQALGADPFGWESDGTSAVLGTMGRSNFLGAYLVLIMPLTVGQFGAAVRRWPLRALLVAQLVVLALSRARAAWLGLLAAALTFGLLWLGVTGRRRLAGRMALLAVAVFGLVVGLAAMSGLLADLVEAGSAAARLTIWRATVPLLAARPLLGYGPDTMALAFQKVLPPELVYYQGRHLAVDRAHNVWLDLGMSTGLVGVATFGALLLVAGHRVCRKLRTTDDRRRQLVTVALAAAIVGHLVELQLSFETVGTGVVFWVLLAAAAAGDCLSDSPSSAARAPILQTRVRSWTTLPLALIFVSLLSLMIVRPLLAERAYWRSKQSDPGSMESLRHSVEAVSHWTVEPWYHLALGQAYWDSGQPASAVSEALIATRLQPGDARMWAALGDLYARWGATDPARYAQAEAAYRHTVALAPTIAAYRTALGLVLVDAGRMEEGIRVIEEAVALDSTDGVAYAHLARLYDAADRTERATWAANQARLWSTVGKRYVGTEATAGHFGGDEQ